MRINSFKSIWLADFEFRQPDGFLPEIRCAVYHEVHSGQTLRLWEPQAADLPDISGRDTLFVAYAANAEFGCLLQMNAALPAYVLDLYAEFRWLTSGLKQEHGHGLLGALAYFGLSGIAANTKTENRELAMREGSQFSPAEQTRLLDYCESDVVALARLLPAMLPYIDLPRALIRGEYMKSVARIERQGIPMDVASYRVLTGNWDQIKSNLVRAVDQDYNVYEEVTFVLQRFEQYLVRHGIAWPRLDSGRLDCSDDTFKDMAGSHPKLQPLRELRTTLSAMRLAGLTIGPDGRNRYAVMPFVSKTGRNQPSNAKCVFGPSTWLRYLIKPEPDTALAYIDFEQQEFGIAAYLAGDTAMMAAYASGDPYLAFGKQAGLIPRCGTKQTHRAERDLCKNVILAVNYGMGANSLAIRLGVSPGRAGELLQLHRRTYPAYWRWSDAVQDHGMLRGKLTCAYGWQVNIGSNPNPLSIRNFPAQGNGSEILRLSCILAHRAGIQICAPVHDALLIEAPLGEIDSAVQSCSAAMARASELVLPGFQLRTEAKIVRAPDRYTEARGERIWNELQKMPIWSTGTT